MYLWDAWAQKNGDSFAVSFWRLKLIHKALILVGLPLVFELCVTGVLFYLLSQAEKESSQARHAQEVIAQDIVLQQLVLDCSNSIGQYLFQETEEARTQYRQAIKRIPVEFDKLSLLLANDPVRLKQSKQIEGITADVINLQAKALDAWKEGNHAASFFIMAQFKLKWDHLMEMMGKLVESDRTANLHNQKTEAQLRDMVKIAIALGVMGNVFLSVSLAVLFDRGTTQRLKVLMSNIRAFSERKPLAQAVGGDDEVGELDAVFHKMANELRRLEQAKEEFIAMVSHDLRTPLTSILMAVELWAKGGFGKPTDEELSTATGASANARRLINLVNTLLDLEKMENEQLRLDRAEVSADSVLEQSAQTVRAIAEGRGLTLNVKGCDEILLVDAERIVQVLVNLISNAIKFSPSGSAITLSAGVDGDDVLFSVTDQGRGIPASDCQKVFDRFYQVSADDGKQERGLGLGLAICKKIVEEHGGRIGVESEEGQGSRFWFTIPR